MAARVAAPDVGKHLARYRQIATVLAEEGLGTLIDAAGLSRFAPGRAKRTADGDAFTVEQRIRRAIERLGPTFIKTGQAISTRTDIVPPTLARELAKLQDECTPEPFEHVRAVIETDLEAPLETLFARFDEQPFAAASLGQVHSATLHDGSEVAVKVQRPDVRRQVETDIDIALTQARFMAEHTDFFGSIDIVEVTEEYADAIKNELDYVLEAKNAERFRKTFADDDTVAFPKVYWEYTSTRVLTLERFEGVRMNRVDELDAAGHDRKELARRGVRCYLTQLFELGFFHADPHPGNFFAMPDGRVGFTDFGRVGTISDFSRERFVDLIWGAVNKDIGMATDSLIAVSSNVGIDEAALKREVGRLISKYHGRELARIDFGELMMETLGLIRGHQLGVPTDFALLISTLGVLEGVGRILDPEFDFATIAKPFADRIVSQRLRPEAVVKHALRSWQHFARIMENAPDTFDKVLRRLASGEVQMTVRPTGYSDLMTQLHELVNRLAFAIVVAALIVGFSTLMSRGDAPRWMMLVGQIGLFAAFVVTFWLFSSVVWNHYRSRRRK